MKPMYSLFPKLFRGLPAEALAGVAQEAGFDGVDLVVREGFIAPERLREEGGEFVRSMRQSGLRVEFAVTPYTPDQLMKDPAPLNTLAELGVKGFRMGYFPYDDTEGLFSQLEKARFRMAGLAELCSRLGLKAVYQVHHGYHQLIQHSFAALYLVEGLPPEHAGIMLDPGNQFHEGREDFRRAVRVLGRYLAGIGVKDVAPRQDGTRLHFPAKGWSEAWATCLEGMTNWEQLGMALQKLEQPVVVNLQPFYEPDDHAKRQALLKEELAYIKRAFEGKGDRV